MRRRSRAPLDPDLARRLRDAAPQDPAATARARDTVLAAHAAREPLAGPPRRRRAAVGALLAAALVALLGTLVLSPAGARVSGWIDEAIGPRPSSPTATLPAPGRLLVSGRNGSWIVEHDLDAIPLAEFTEAGWSAKGNYIVLNRGDALFARDAAGRTRWSLSRPSISHVAWSGGDGYRVAYRSGAALRVVDGDGSGDRLLVPRSAAVTPAWRPGPPHAHVLAYAGPRGQVVLNDVDAAPGASPTTASGPVGAAGRSRVLLAPTADGAPVEGLAWVAADRLLVLRGGGLLLLDVRGRLLSHVRPPADGRFAALTASPRTRTAAFVRRRPRSGTSIVWTVRFASRETSPPRGGVRLLGGDARIAFAGSGTVRSLAFSPDGRWLAFAWPPSDQWIFQRVRGRPRLSTVARATRRLGHVGDPVDSAIVGWAK